MKSTDEIRKACGEELKWLHFEIGISTRDLGRFLGVNRMKVYRWLGGEGFLLPPMENAHSILTMAETVTKMKNDITDLIVGWQNGNDYHGVVVNELFHKKYIKILNSKLSLKDKVLKIVQVMIKNWLEKEGR